MIQLVYQNQMKVGLQTKIPKFILGLVYFCQKCSGMVIPLNLGLGDLYHLLKILLEHHFILSCLSRFLDFMDLTTFLHFQQCLALHPLIP